MSKKTLTYSPGGSTALIAGALFIAVLAFALAKEMGVIEGNIAKRAAGMSFGVLLIITGNLLPKIVRPLNAQPRGARRTMAGERFAGRTFVLAGIIYIAIWLLAPQTYAMLISSLIGLGAFALIGAVWAWQALGASPQSTKIKEEPLMSETSSIIRTFIFAMLHTLVWVFAMFLADSIWGDRVAQAMVIPFTISNTVLAVFLLRMFRRAQRQSSE